MTSEQRREELVRLLRQRGGMAARDLCDHFRVSRMTIYRDLRALEAANQVVRVPGGVASVPAAAEAAGCGCLASQVPHQQCRVESGRRQSWHCCSSCGLERLSADPQARLWVRDFLSASWLPAEEGYFLLNSMVAPCCRPSILSFARESEVLNFRSGFGGAIARLDQALDYLQLERTLSRKGS